MAMYFGVKPNEINYDEIRQKVLSGEMSLKEAYALISPLDAVAQMEKVRPGIQYLSQTRHPARFKRAQTDAPEIKSEKLCMPPMIGGTDPGLPFDCSYLTASGGSILVDSIIPALKKGIVNETKIAKSAFKVSTYELFASIAKLTDGLGPTRIQMGTEEICIPPMFVGADPGLPFDCSFLSDRNVWAEAAKEARKELEEAGNGNALLIGLNKAIFDLLNLIPGLGVAKLLIKANKPIRFVIGFASGAASNAAIDLAHTYGNDDMTNQEKMKSMGISAIVGGIVNRVLAGLEELKSIFVGKFPKHNENLNINQPKSLEMLKKGEKYTAESNNHYNIRYSDVSKQINSKKANTIPKNHMDNSNLMSPELELLFSRLGYNTNDINNSIVAADKIAAKLTAKLDKSISVKSLHRNMEKIYREIEHLPKDAAVSKDTIYAMKQGVNRFKQFSTTNKGGIQHLNTHARDLISNNFEKYEKSMKSRGTPLMDGGSDVLSNIAANFFARKAIDNIIADRDGKEVSLSPESINQETIVYRPAPVGINSTIDYGTLSYMLKKMEWEEYNRRIRD